MRQVIKPSHVANEKVRKKREVKWFPKSLRKSLKDLEKDQNILHPCSQGAFSFLINPLSYGPIISEGDFWV